MTPVQLGLICGLAFGAVTVLTMVFAPIQWPTPRQKQEAMLAAFLSRFMIGFLIPVVNLNIPPVLKGILISVGISLSPAIISRRSHVHAWVPIMIGAIVGGAVIGWIAG